MVRDRVKAPIPAFYKDKALVVVPSLLRMLHILIRNIWYIVEYIYNL